jgi:hypothetical protein
LDLLAQGQHGRIWSGRESRALDLVGHEAGERRRLTSAIFRLISAPATIWE